MGQSNWLIAKTKTKKTKQTMNLGSISLIKKSNKLYGLKHVYPFFNLDTKIHITMGTSNFTYIQGYE
jgi:hypothetical protein